MAITKLITGSITDETITSTKIDDGAITNAKINASAGIDISKTVFTGAQPTISALSISQKDPDVSSNVTITGTNFESIPIVQFLNTTTGARITSATVTYTSSTSITAVFPASQTIGIYKVIVENPTSLSVISTATIINSAAPNWVTNASLGSVEEGDTVNIQLLAYDDDSTAVSSYSLQSGSLPSGVTLSGDSTVGALTGTAPTVAADTAYNFTIRATDDESQTTDKAFSLTVADYNIGNSLIFNDDDSAYLSRTPSSAGNRKTWTWSGWVKRAGTGTRQWLFSTGTSGSNYGHFMIDSDDKLYYVQEATTLYRIGSNQKLRDHSAWYHLMFVMDTTNATSNDRMRYYVNGERVDVGVFNTQPSQNTDMVFNQSASHSIGKNNYTSSYADFYLAEVHFIDGTALTPTSFGETNANGVWIPKKYTGSYGTNGFVLEFDDSSDFGTDTSGNGNDFTANNLAATDQSQDSPHLNYATLNPLVYTSGGANYSEGNLKVNTNDATRSAGVSTQGVSTGKWYWEIKLTSGASNSQLGISYNPQELTRTTTSVGETADSWSYVPPTGKIRNNAVDLFSASTLADNDIMNIALDLDNNYVYFGKNGTWQNSGDPTSGASGTGGFSLTAGEEYFFIGGDRTIGGGATQEVNFGNPSFSISSGNSDGNGYGNFEYAVPTGFYALNSKNLATYG